LKNTRPTSHQRRPHCAACRRITNSRASFEVAKGLPLQVGFTAPYAGAKLREFIDRQIARWEAEDARKGGPPTEEERNNRWLWEAMTEETEWDRFYGEPVEECPRVLNIKHLPNFKPGWSFKPISDAQTGDMACRKANGAILSSWASMATATKSSATLISGYTAAPSSAQSLSPSSSLSARYTASAGR
jgi:hypothetical protein